MTTAPGCSTTSRVTVPVATRTSSTLRLTTAPEYTVRLLRISGGASACAWSCIPDESTHPAAVTPSGLPSPNSDDSFGAASSAAGRLGHDDDVPHQFTQQDELSDVHRLLRSCLLYTSPSPRDRTR